ncbi:PAS domain S-box protein [Marinilongibacter aquaticus]|uniref:hybrid sensor histidine kinase/response regulator n=1 Tax=Marinilongibacter aquaticus TaxID=2975157 RepID=UPI0021BD0BAA|nr:hybrid sensor histidine kinase/response regulator [Marinilongibacter aquaticus]UBM60651.1 PAS domain S-box protein [Marinilongibacter aquaticus]
MSLIRINVLLVEDDEDDYFITKMLMSKFNQYECNLIWAKSFAEGIDLIRKRNFDVYLFDYLLGGESGLSLLEALRGKEVDLPAIMLTGKGDFRVDEKAVDLGAYDYLEKDTLTADSLERSMRYALKHSQTLKALRESEAKYRTVIEHSKEVIFIANEHFNIVDISGTVEEYLGYTRQEVYNMQSQELFKDPIQLLRLQDEMMERGGIRDFKLEVKAKNGESKMGLLSCVLEKDKQNRTFIHGVFSDQTHRIRAEKATLQSQKLHSTARLMQVLAHEVRNPLMNIQLSLGALYDSVRTDDDQVLLDMIKRNAGRIDQLINEVLNAASEKEVVLRPEDLNKAVDQAIEQVQDRIQMQSVSLNWDREVLPVIRMNLEQVATALVNILVNGIEAMEGRARKELCIKSYAKDDFIVVSISDTGVGMDSELQAKLFEPFYTAKTNGVGLGLATTLGILKSHGAHIEVESTLNEGSCFTLQFPVE